MLTLIYHFSATVFCEDGHLLNKPGSFDHLISASFDSPAREAPVDLLLCDNRPGPSHP